jgi:Uma2 family endonuclease
VTYDRGNLELMSPSYRHERYKRLIGRFIDILAEEYNIPIIGGGSTTFKRQDLERGLEPDECYYIQNAFAVLGKQEIDLNSDPPPDLAIEIDISSSSINRMSIYAELGVSEIWRYDGTTLKVYRLSPSSEYVEVNQSPTFSSLPLLELNQFLQPSEMSDDTKLFRSFRTWVRGFSS